MPPGLDDKMLTGYLLGELSEEQQTQVEEQLFSDHACYDRLLALKAEITDEYVQETLAPSRRDVFARRFLTTEPGREDALFARALDGVLRKEKTQRNPVAPEQSPVSWWQSVVIFFRSASGWQMGMAVAMVVLMIGVAWLFFERQRLGQRLETTISERDAAQSGAQKVAQLEEEIGRANSRNQELDQELQQTRKDLDQLRQEFEKIARPSQTSSGFGTIFSFFLAPGARRGNERVEKLIPTPQARLVQLQLLLEPGENGTRYRAEIRTKEGTLIHSQDQLRSLRTDKGKALLVTIPADRLKDGLYEVSLYGASPAGGSEIINYYDFSITRR